MMTQQDLKQLAQKGISEQQIETQLGLLPPSVVVS